MERRQQHQQASKQAAVVEVRGCKSPEPKFSFVAKESPLCVDFLFCHDSVPTYYLPPNSFLRCFVCERMHRASRKPARMEGRIGKRERGESEGTDSCGYDKKIS